ncbi:hypothetical protein [Mesorhizobium amorphae]|uniref:hypothetical protein n=1 Tax=Mesorhizobium amorphae TaxID=71433 RepID=UPI001782A86F|nr:hypothetical protein [Mesorhizobium amorphae]
MWKFFLFLLVSFAMISPASAIDESYLGQWSAKTVCDLDDLTITQKGISGQEYACKTTKSKKSKSGWNLTLSCAGEGVEYTTNATFLLLRNGRLRQTIKGQATEFRRCRGASSEVPPKKQTGAKLDTPWGRLTPRQFTLRCVECFNEAQSMGRGIGGYCPGDCVEIFSTQMTCDNQGKCRANP